MRIRSLLHGAAVSVMVATPVIAQDVRDSPGPVEKQARQVSLENPVPRRLASTPVEYPAQMHLSGGRGLINLQITLDASGKVAEIRSTSAQLIQPAGPINSAEERETTDALLKSAIAAAREWTFAPPADGPLTFQAAFMFFNGTVDVVLAPPASTRGRGAGATGARGAAVPPVPWAAAEGAYRVGGDIPPPRRTKNAAPDYPREAQDKRIQGVVIMEVVIAPNGKVRDARVLRSVPGLDQAALAAVRKWEYAPTQRNGVAVPIVMTVTMTFTLN